VFFEKGGGEGGGYRVFDEKVTVDGVCVRGEEGVDGATQPCVCLCV